MLPNYVAPEFEHMSHATQHQPITSSPTNYGANIVQVTAHWDMPKHFTLDLSEGYDLDKRWAGANPTCGEIEGPREQFTAKIGYKFIIK